MKDEAKLEFKDANMESSTGKEKVSGVLDTYKLFCIRFVRLNGILFTRTSMENFADVLSLVSNDLRELLSSGPEEELNFDTDAAENSLLCIRLVSILIFTVHNLKREREGQTYADTVQRSALLQNAFTAVFELMGHVIERCSQVQDVSSSYSLPAIMVFVEWLACYPDVADADCDADKKQSIARSYFWKHCISLLNKVLSIRQMCMVIMKMRVETSFFNMNKYEGEIENHLALPEDSELRGFLPLAPAHTILDFSRNHSFVSNSDKEKKVRVKRILAAGKALTNAMRVDQKTVYFDPKANMFFIGVGPSKDVTHSSSALPATNCVGHETPSEKYASDNDGNVQRPTPRPKMGKEEDDDDDDEVIVFQPVVSEKRTEVIGPKWPPSEPLKLSQSSSAHDLKFYGSTMSAPLDRLNHQNTFGASPIPVSAESILPQYLQTVQMHASRWSVEEAMSLVNSMNGLTMLENGHLTKRDMQENVGLSHSTTRTADGICYSQIKVPETVMPSRIDPMVSSRVTGDALAAKTTSVSQFDMRRNPISRPVRHLGPPPGFSPAPLKPPSESVTTSDSDNPLMDDYKWLDGYQLSSLKSSGIDGSLNYASHADTLYVNNSSNGVNGTISFPFPGKQVPMVQFQTEKQKRWPDYNTLEHLKIQHEQKLQQQQIMNGNQQFTSLPEQYKGQPVWTSRYFV